MRTRRVGFALVFALAAACHRAEVAASRPVGPSPLLAMDPDRLWILVHLKGLANADCGYYYADPTDARYLRIAENCGRWERESLEWLRANGAPDVKPEHLRSKAFWTWYREKLEGLERCLHAADQITNASEAEHAKQACGPTILGDYIEVNGKPVENLRELGIVPPKREAGE
jgi:hypothetical protein